MPKGPKVIQAKQRGMPQMPNMAQMQEMQRRQQQAAANQPPPFVVCKLDSERINASFDPEKKFNNWAVIYPIYIDSTKTLAQGRRVSKELAVVRPQPVEIAEACLRLGFGEVIVENYKRHPQTWGEVGRVRLVLSEDGLPVHGDIMTKKKLLKALCEQIPKQESRTKPQPQQQLEDASAGTSAAAPGQNQAAAKAAPKASGKVGKSKGKKNKTKKRR